MIKPANTERNFAVLRHLVPHLWYRQLLNDAMIGDGGGIAERAPAVLPAHYDPGGSSTPQSILDITKKKTPLTCACVFTQLEQLCSVLCLDVYREWQLEKKQYEILRGVVITAKFIFMREASTLADSARILMVVDTNAELESHDFPPPGEAVKFLLVVSSGHIMLTDFVNESQDLNLDVLGLDLEIKAHSRA